VYASHVFEHVLQREVLATLKGIHRVLRPKGKLYISVPDLDVLCQLFLDPNSTKEIRFHAMRMMFGGQIDNFDIHYMGWNQEFMFDHLSMAGFSMAKRVESLGIFSDDYSNFKPYGIPISLNVIAIK
jgi:predicted SAM-dependent methyltransferase